MRELGYDEGSKPGARAKLKAFKWQQQNGNRPDCPDPLRLKYSSSTGRADLRVAALQDSKKGNALAKVVITFYIDKETPPLAFFKAVR